MGKAGRDGVRGGGDLTGDSGENIIRRGVVCGNGVVDGGGVPTGGGFLVDTGSVCDRRRR